MSGMQSTDTMLMRSKWAKPNSAYCLLNQAPMHPYIARYQDWTCISHGQQKTSRPRRNDISAPTISLTTRLYIASPGVLLLRYSTTCGTTPYMVLTCAKMSRSHWTRNERIILYQLTLKSKRDSLQVVRCRYQSATVPTTGLTHSQSQKSPPRQRIN